MKKQNQVKKDKNLTNEIFQLPLKRKTVLKRTKNKIKKFQKNPKELKNNKKKKIFQRKINYKKTINKMNKKTQIQQLKIKVINPK